MFPSKLLNSLKTLNQLPSIAWGPHKILLKKIDGLRVLFLNVATAPSRPRRDGANAQSVYLIEKDCN
ncbi:hypothetical protein Y032_0089g2275 [Ancylostoma ceylanicum]|uniref:Uncharacterized protein n=1 Tax=Ancylostoma ceylanicum TaxID=53326 RepID=A0A016TNZ8_9BILA|nr:hypothetical protein Y032_0089g2275 [Ancylostoma ceylanicum]